MGGMSKDYRVNFNFCHTIGTWKCPHCDSMETLECKSFWQFPSDGECGECGSQASFWLEADGDVEYYHIVLEYTPEGGWLSD